MKSYISIFISAISASLLATYLSYSVVVGLVNFKVSDIIPLSIRPAIL